LCRILPHVGGADVRVILGEDRPLRAELESLGVAVEVVAMSADLGSARRAELARRLPVRQFLLTLLHPCRATTPHGSTAGHLAHEQQGHIYGGIAARTLGIPQVWHARDRLALEYLAGLGYWITNVAASTLLSYFIANSGEHDAHGPPAARAPESGCFPRR
jgi:hypothetical protein